MHLEKNKEKRLNESQDIKWGIRYSYNWGKKKSEVGIKPSTRHHLTDTYSLQRKSELLLSSAWDQRKYTATLVELY